MKKIRLNLDELEVESFETTPAMEKEQVFGYGTVVTCPETCPLSDCSCPRAACMCTDDEFICY